MMKTGYAGPVFVMEFVSSFILLKRSMTLV